ncbi:MAG: 8-oxo-dGTP diphosphatase [Ruminococcaceae bacterium]|nr:8-oxo-dGTP diphosphatase [Oscillospiraceae bacterium]
MKITTLCYIKCGNKTLMMYRNKKKSDENAGKWVGIGGKLEDGESPEECLIREVREECGIELKKYSLRGLITFVSDVWGTEFMCLYTGETNSEDISECAEGELHWIKEKELEDLPMWEGDRIFFDLMKAERPFFSLKLTYTGDKLTKASLDGENINL